MDQSILDEPIEVVFAMGELSTTTSMIRSFNKLSIKRTSKASFSQRRDTPWFNLPIDIAGEIISMLESARDCLNFLSAFKLGKSGAQIIYRCPGNIRNSILLAKYSLPMILHTFEDATKSPYLYSILDKKAYPLPHCLWLDLSKQRIVATWKGWLVVTDFNPTKQSRMHLLNPVTKKYLDLPRWWTFKISRTLINFSTLNRVLIASPDSTTHLSVMCSVFALAGNYGDLYYCRIGGTCNDWIHLSPQFCNVSDLTVYQGKLYAVRFNGSLLAMELTYPCKKPKIVVSRDQHDVLLKNYIVESISGELLLIRRLKICVRELDTNHSYETRGFKVCKLKNLNKFAKVAEYTWEEIQSLGDQILFVGYNGAKCFKSSLYPGFGKNCIYFSHDFGRRDLSGPRNIGVYYMKDKRIEYFSDLDDYSSVRFQVAAVWFSPNW